jgi:hypothetical protein
MAIEAAAGLAGGCQCGAVRYRLMAEPTGVNVCHCRMCQKAGGGPFMTFGGVRLAEFVVTRGAISIFKSSDIAERGFCAHCGTPLTYRGFGADRVSVTLGSLDDPNEVEPTGQLGVESKVRWLARSLATPETPTDQWLARKKIAAIGNHQYPDHEV